jgi:hypothetical protein
MPTPRTTRSAAIAGAEKVHPLVREDMTGKDHQTRIAGKEDPVRATVHHPG